jgi:hypothetical protein
LADPRLDVRGTAEIDLSRAGSLLLARAPALKDAGLEGRVRGPFILKGPAKNPLAWDLQLDGSSPVVFVRNRIRLDNFEVQVRLNRGALNLPYLHATPYGGTAGASVFMDLTRPEPVFNAKVFANQIQLAGVARDLELKDPQFSGTTIFDLDLRGIVTRPESWTGAGTIDVRQGHLWQTDLFKKMGELPFVKVSGLDLVTFTALNGAFRVGDRRVWTENLQLFSETVVLAFSGSVGFDQTLDLGMDISYSKGIFEGAMDTGGIVPFVIEQASAMISHYHVGGTIAKPKNERLLVPPAKSVGKKFAGAVQGLVQ